MPADKLTLLCRYISRKFENLAMENGKPKGGYSRFVDLRAESNLPAFLYCRGIHNGINKIEFTSVAQLGLTRTMEIADRICGDLRATTIFRVDWCVDLLGVPVQDLALYCRISSAQNCSVERSRGGTSFYLRRSKTHVLVVYDRLRRMRAIGDPMATIYAGDDYLTRVEVQFRGGGVPFRRFLEMRRYAQIDFFPGLSFWRLPLKRQGLKPMQSLAAEGLLNRIERFGVQATSKMYSAQEWAYVAKKFLEPIPQSELPDLNELMRKSAREWLNDRIRFPRGPEDERRESSVPPIALN